METVLGCRDEPPIPVEPRGCGGISTFVRRFLEQEGGAPRVRGNPIFLGSERRQCGWSPAGAGESSAKDAAAKTTKVEPRAYGV